jgi:predicted MFS family arabinose efflux permease
MLNGSQARLLATACVAQLVTYAITFNLTPLYPEVGSDLGLDAGSLGVLVGLGGVVALLVQLPAGSGGDAYGRRPFFAVGMLCLLVGLGLRFQAQEAAFLLWGQVATGAALGMVSLNAFAVGAEVASGRGQAQSIGIVNASISVGQVVGYLLAGTLGAALGWRMLSLVMMVLPALTLLPVLSEPGLARPAAQSTRPGPLAVLRALSDPRRLALAALAALTLGAGQGVTYLLPFVLLSDTHSLGPLAAAVLLVPYVIGSVIAAPLSGGMAEHFGVVRAVVGALLLGTAVCVALIWFRGSIIALAIGNVLIGASVNSTLPMVSVQTVRMKSGNQAIGAGTALAGLRMGQSLGPFIGPTLAGAALARGGTEVAWLALGVCFVVSIALHAVASRPS